MANEPNKEFNGDVLEYKFTKSKVMCLLLFVTLVVLTEFKLVDQAISITNKVDLLIPIDFPVITRLCKVLYIICGTVAITAIIRRIISCMKSKTKRAQTLSVLFYNAIGYISVIVAAILILVALGVNVVGIATTVGILGIVVGFGAESLIADVFTGICMIFENQFNVGDIIEVNGFRGKVVQIGIRTISIRDTGDNIKVMNNSEVKNVLNCSFKSSVAVCDFPISYDADLEAVEEILEKTIGDITDRYYDIFEEIVYSGVDKLADSAINLRVVGKTRETDIFKARRILNREVYLAFKKNNVEIPFQQVVVHEEK